MSTALALDSVSLAEALTGAQRAAILVMYLQPEVARQLLMQMSTSELQEMGLSMAGVETIDPGVIESVVGVFIRDLYHASMVPQTGKAYALKVLPGLIDDDRRERVLLKVRRAVSTEFQEFIAERPARTVATLIRDEHPQAQALALILMGPENAASVLEFMDEHEQLELSLRMPLIESIPADLADDVERSLREALEDKGAGIWNVEGLDETAQILGRLGKPVQDPLLGHIEAHDSDLSDYLRNRMVRFSDLGMLDDRNMQQLLKNIERTALLPALRGAEPKLRDLILRNMSSRAAADVRDELELMGKLPRAEVDSAQQEIVQIALQLRDEGTLNLAIGGGDDMV